MVNLAIGTRCSAFNRFPTSLAYLLGYAITAQLGSIILLLETFATQRDFTRGADKALLMVKPLCSLYSLSIFDGLATSYTDLVFILKRVWLWLAKNAIAHQYRRAGWRGFYNKLKDLPNTWLPWQTAYFKFDHSLVA
jgi:hypothetical protein